MKCQVLFSLKTMRKYNIICMSSAAAEVALYGLYNSLIANIL